MSEIEKRLKSLERTNRRWRYATGLFAALLLTSLAIGAKDSDPVPDVLQARRIEVVAPDGKPAIVLNASNKGSSLILTAQGKDHKRIIGLSAYEEGVSLALMKHAEAPLFMAIVEDKGSTLAISDGREPSQKPGSIVLRSFSPTEDSPGATMINLTKGPSDIKAGLLSLENDKGSFLALGGDKGKNVIIRVNQENGKVCFCDKNDKALWTMP